MASKDAPLPAGAAPNKPLSPAAERALAVAAQRRAELERTAATERAKEIGRRSGPERARYGDWEKNGRCIDF